MKNFLEWLEVPVRQFTSDGTNNGIVTIDSTVGFYVSQKVIVRANTQKNKQLQVKKVLSPTQLLVGPIDNNWHRYSSIDLYTVADNATIEAPEQTIDITNNDPKIAQAVYEFHPLSAIRTIMVDNIGNFFSEDNPMPVQLSSGSIDIGTVNAELEVQLSRRDDDPDAGDIHDSVRIGNQDLELGFNDLGGGTGEALVHDQDVLEAVQEVSDALTDFNDDFNDLSRDYGPTDANTLRVTANINTQDGPIDVNISGQTGIDGIYSSPDNEDPSNVGMILHERSNPTLDSHQIQRVTAIRGAEDTTHVSQDVSLHDKNGDGISSNKDLVGNRSVHALSPNNTNSGTLGALNDIITLPVTGLNSVGFQISAGTLIGTIKPQSSIDGGLTWSDVTFFDVRNNAVVGSVTFAAPNTLRVLSILPVGGATHARVIVESYTNGSAGAIITASEVGMMNSPSGISTFNQISNQTVIIPKNTPVLALPANVNRKYAYIANNTNKTVHIQLGNSVGLSLVTGMPLDGNSVFQLTGSNLYTGDVYVYCGSDIILSVTEGTP